ncbi:MAG TPA: hypothetical protein VKT82_34955 [Ktedonobacterales bacterium]|nr:hypothetical protein [Ktedonobacterales bacterium]
MSFYQPEQRCPRCRFPYTQGVFTCPNCGLALADPSAPRANRSGPQPSWQSTNYEGYGTPPPADRFGGSGPSGPGMYRPDGQYAPGGSGPWRNDAGAAPGRSGPQFQPRPGGYAGAGERIVDTGAPTSYQRPQPGQSSPSAGWAGSSGGQQPSSGYRGMPPGWGSPAGAERPFADPQQSASGRGMPSGYQRPSPAGRDAYAAYQDGAIDAPETLADAYNDATPPYSGSQAFRGASTPMYQPGGQPWQQQQYAAAPAAYPGGQQGYGDPYGQYSQPEPPRRSKKTALVVLLVIVLLAAVGGGAAYLFLGSKPTITVTSKYTVGTTPAGAASTTLQVNGLKFAPHSAVSFLIDGQPEPGHEIFQSDASGAVQGNLTVTSAWPLGQHSLTAKDASGNTTFQGKTVAIVTQGEAGTPGPKGAPADDTPSFTIHATVHSHSKDSGQNISYPYSLVVTGQPDPAGGKVCSSQDTGKLQTNKSTSNGLRVTETYVPTCSGTYKSGKITYTETFSNYKLAFSNGVTCTVAAPFINQELDGSFTSATSISGTLSSDTPTITCSNGNSVTSKGVDGTWAGSISA